MNEKVKTTLWVLGYTFLAGTLLAVFSVLTEIYKYIFSLLAIYIGIRFFRRFETLGLRITFFVLGIFFYFLVAVIFAMVAFIRDNPLPAAG
ncbi:hypothetical protein [Paenibacillus arenilitoris]|uniref:Uncharacterized protein n=1 Tax=Paenibacillus arenilitoris TaxID=2772299 RepID=A0A927H9B4_9BACL|nr:hypothetical protein [Paenibacillus arenilitoris]MBD2871444.1 hypothetical protein [Paenibacillus arenilitoris]